MQLSKRNSVRPRLEQLEDRLAPTTLAVTPTPTLPTSAHVPNGQTIGTAASAAQVSTHSVVQIKA